RSGGASRFIDLLLTDDKGGVPDFLDRAPWKRREQREARRGDPAAPKASAFDRAAALWDRVATKRCGVDFPRGGGREIRDTPHLTFEQSARAVHFASFPRSARGAVDRGREKRTKNRSRRGVASNAFASATSTSRHYATRGGRVRLRLPTRDRR